ncbi:hypothetical protein, partial [Streptomyces sp. NPDC127197]|uniref:hypothetical protein n=1 Tax=Streptomyces sp. NPDC127197 TaxID=3345388 RepID=UPI00363E3C99
TPPAPSPLLSTNQQHTRPATTPHTNKPPSKRQHVEVLPDGTEVKLGVFLSNTKSRRAKLTADKLQQLADLGLEWAA